MALRLFKPACPHSLRNRLLAAYATGMLLTVALVAVIFILMFTWQFEAYVEHRLKEAAESAASRLSVDATGRPVKFTLPPDLQWIYDELPGDLDFRVVDANGSVVLTPERHGGALLPPDMRIAPSPASDVIDLAGRTIHIATVPIAGAAAPLYMQVASSTRLTTLFRVIVRGPLKISLFLTLLISIPVLGGLMLLVLRSLLRPLDEASAAAARIGPRNLAARLPTRRAPKEVLPLVDALNQALDRLEIGYRSQQEFLAAAAHELKTPLALLRGQIEMEGTADRATLLNDIDVMARQVHQLLHLAEVSEVQNYSMQHIDAATVAADAVNFLSRLAERKEVELILQMPTAAANWTGDESALFTLIKNLGENAIQHSHPGGIVTIALDADGLSVKDEGAGIASEHLPHLFKRFWRGPNNAEDKSGGAGLGLSICSEIATAHGWRLQAIDGSPGAHFRLNI
jgi:two-component system, OmpR family, sensor histidine kinase QseC